MGREGVKIDFGNFAQNILKQRQAFETATLKAKLAQQRAKEEAATLKKSLQEQGLVAPDQRPNAQVQGQVSQQPGLNPLNPLSRQGPVQSLVGGGFGDIQGNRVSQQGFGARNDGTQKGPGFFGTLQRPDGRVSTELSIGVDIDGKEVQIPSLVPTLTEQEKNHLLGGGQPTKEIVDKAVVHAKQRVSQGQSPFAQQGEQQSRRVQPGQQEEPPFIEFRGRLFANPRFDKDKEKTPEQKVQAIREKGFETQQTKRAERSIKIESGARAAISNLELVSGVGRDFMQVYVDAVKEGGAGGFAQQKIGQFATKVGDIPKGIPALGGTSETIKFGSKFKRTGTLEGKRSEFLLKMMPMLSQQTEKGEGSVRMVASILQALGKTIPDSNTAPEAAGEQVAETMRTFFRFARAAENNRLSFDKEFSKMDVDDLVFTREIKNRKGKVISTEDVPSPELSRWISKVSQVIDRVQLSPEEQAQIDAIIGEVNGPLTAHLNQISEPTREKQRIPGETIRFQDIPFKHPKKIGRFTVEVE